MKKYIIAALLAGGLAAPAWAQDDRGTFTGFRVEGLAGYDQLRSGNQDDDGTDTSEDDGDESIDGVAYGIAGGYDFDLGNVVAGVEAEFSESSGKADFDETVDGFGGNLAVGRDIYVGGRLGFKAGQNALIYAKGGYTNTSIDATVNNGTDSIDVGTDVEGFRAGFGGEVLFGNNLYGKVEYRYSNYSNLELVDNGTDDDIDVDLDRHQVVAGVGVRF